MKKTFIDGADRRSPPIGYCHNRIHKGYLDIGLLKKHGCLRKQCTFLQRFESNPFWMKREELRQKKREKKSREF
jgi:hypothetical protein